MDIDSWSSDMRSKSDLAMPSYTSGGQSHPPSIGNVRQIVVSEASGGSQIYSDGQPPSVNDVGRREASQSEPSCTRYDYEGPDELEVQQQVCKRGAAAAGTSNEISAFSGYDKRTQDLVSRFGSEISQPVTKAPLPQLHRWTFNPINIDFAINENGFLNGSVLFPSPQPFQRMRTNVKVSKRGSIGRVIDITAYSGYDHLLQDLARMFGIAEDQQRSEWKLVFVDLQNDILLVGEDPWDEFVNCVRYIKILSSEEVGQEMRLDADFLGNSVVVPNQACSSLVVEQAIASFPTLFRP